MQRTSKPVNKKRWLVALLELYSLPAGTEFIPLLQGTQSFQQ
jgi:hypothetical protein